MNKIGEETARMDFTIDKAANGYILRLQDCALRWKAAYVAKDHKELMQIIDQLVEEKIDK